MKEKILHTASEMFLALGFKSVTMDDVAQRLAISKKTIYEYYQSKTALVSATTHYVFEQIRQNIDRICCVDCNISAIHNLFHIHHFIKSQITEDNAPEYQLQKFYPKIFDSLKIKKHKLITEGITENLERGIAQGIYRKDMDIPTIARLYYANTIAVRNTDIFPLDTYKVSQVMRTYLIYHIRAIATPKGIKELEIFLKNEN
jgi:AcrR family transcriptional regulator